MLAALLLVACAKGDRGGSSEAPCGPGQTSCGAECVFLDSNALHCGSCGAACQAGASCTAAQCGCPTGQLECGSACVDASRDAVNCGVCGMMCGVGQSCTEASCSCQPGFGDCGAGCVDLSADVGNCGVCGAACTTGQLCGGAGCECQGGLTACVGVCNDLASDGENCGQCGLSCGGATPVCSLGACAAECAAGLTQCGSSCVDVASSVEHCGQCGTACPAGLTCVAGACACLEGQASCDGQCVVTDRNPFHCGACGVACSGGQQCNGGVCGCANAGEQLCEGACVDTLTNALNCGACGNACAGGSQCVTGACACPTAGEVQCGGVCIDTQRDPANCGACGNACPGGGACTAGVCSDVGTGGAGGGSGGGGTVVVDFEALSPYAYLRKVKNLTTGLAPTDAEVEVLVAAPEAERAAVLRQMIAGWINTEHVDLFRGKMIKHFVNTFQQTGFTPTEDFKLQLLENGGFDFNVLGIYGDDAFPRLVQNLQESFARTAWEIVQSGEPFTNVLTTDRFMMTSGLMSLYLQIEMPNDEPYSFSGFGATPAVCSTTDDCETGHCIDGQCRPPRWWIDTSSSPIPLEDTLNPSSPNYMVFSDEPPAMSTCFDLSPTCRDSGELHEFGNPGFNATNGPTGGYAQLFQRLLGFTPRWRFLGQPECWEHCSKPYFTTADLTDWRLVAITPKPDGERYVQPYDLPAIRAASALRLELPRIGFFTTPAFLAVWNTNDSNQHRVTANQALLVALNKSFTSDASINPTNMFGLDDVHVVVGSECHGCHKSLDPIRAFWETQFDFDDRNDFPTNTFGGTSNPRPTTTGGGFAFGNVNSQGSNMTDLGNLLAQVTDSTSADPDPISRFAISMTQYLCYWADSAKCSERDPTFRGVARNFQESGFDFKTLYLDLLSSPLVTAAAATSSYEDRNVSISIARRRHLCAALSNRLNVPDICALDVAFPFENGFSSFGSSSPYTAQRATNRIAGSVADDAFSRGSDVPVTPAVPTLFYRAASELVCEDVAARVVGSSGFFSTSDPAGSMATMVEVVMGYAASDPKHDPALAILGEHYQAAGASTDALRSTFALACQSPSSLGMGI